MKNQDNHGVTRIVRHRSKTQETDVLALIAAASERSALGRLTEDCTLPYGADHRVIDFPMANCLASGIRRIALLTHRKPHSLVTYVQRCAAALSDPDDFIEVWSTRRRGAVSQYPVAFDVLLQNLELIAELAPKRVLLLSGHRVYRMDYRSLLETHAAAGCGVTVGCIEMPESVARQHDVVTLDARGRVARIEPPRAKLAAHAAGNALVSMGVYVFDRDLLIDSLSVDAADEASSHDFTHDLIPLLIRANGVHAHVLQDRSGAPAYWRDVDTVDGYWQANMDLLHHGAKVDLSGAPFAEPARAAPYVVGEGSAVRSIIAGGCAVAGQVRDSLLSADCCVEPDAIVDSSIVFPGARIGRGCRVHRSIVGADCVLPEDTVIGEKPESDIGRFAVSPRGVVVVTPDKAERRQRLRLA